MALLFHVEKLSTVDFNWYFCDCVFPTGKVTDFEEPSVLRGNVKSCEISANRKGKSMVKLKATNSSSMTFHFLSKNALPPYSNIFEKQNLQSSFCNRICRV